MTATLVEIRSPFDHEELGHLFIVLRSVQKSLDSDMAEKNYALTLKILSLYSEKPIDRNGKPA